MRHPRSGRVFHSALRRNQRYCYKRKSYVKRGQNIRRSIAAEMDRESGMATDIAKLFAALAALGRQNHRLLRGHDENKAVHAQRENFIGAVMVPGIFVGLGFYGYRCSSCESACRWRSPSRPVIEWPFRMIMAEIAPPNAARLFKTLSDPRKARIYRWPGKNSGKPGIKTIMRRWSMAQALSVKNDSQDYEE